MKIGEQVRHLSRPDMGAGKIAELYADGTCQIVFPHGRFSGIPIDTVVSIETELAAAQSRKYLLEEIHGKFETAFMDADAFFNASYAHRKSVV